MAHAHSYLALSEDLGIEYLRDRFSYENHSLIFRYKNIHFYKYTFQK